MLRLIRSLGVPSLGWLLVSGACTVKTPDDGTPSGGSAGAAPSSKGGSGGTAGHSGSSKGGKGNTGGSQAVGGAAGDGAEGGSGGAAECPGCSSGFCLEDGTCVDCLATSDQCPDGQYCTDANACAPGCKADGASCVSGVCAADHNCQSCINDSECVAPLVCSHGACSEPCTLAQEGQTASCAEDLVCCSLHCTHVNTDSAHCGACGNTCGAGQFCGLTDCSNAGAGGAGADPASCVTCHDTTLTNVCAIANIVVLLDTSKNAADGNRVVGRSIGAALATQCATQPVVTEAEQDSVDALNFKTGRPVSGGGELLVVAGGPFYQVLEGYLEDERISPLYWHVEGEQTEFRRSADDEVVVALPIAGDHDASDYFIIQFMRDAASGSLVLNAQGMWLSGTIAAAYQLTHGLLPDLSTVNQAWYAYEWVDANGDLAPSLDEIQLQASGN